MEPKLLEQLEKILVNHRTRKERQPLAPGTKATYRYVLEQLVKFASARQLGRRLESLADFTEQDMKDFQKRLEQEPTVNGGTRKPASIKSDLMSLRTIFGAAHKTGLAQSNIAKCLDLSWVAESEEGRRIMPEEVERLCRFDKGSLQAMSLRDRYFYLRGLAMLRLQKDAALRPGEVVRLCEEDVLWHKRQPNGVVPIVIQEPKRRPVGTKDSGYLTSWSTEILKLYLEIRLEFCRAKNVVPQPMFSKWDKRPLGTALFLTEKGKAIGVMGYYETFRSAAKAAQIDVVYSPHDLRHTRICEWVDQQKLNVREVQELARHGNVAFTLQRYYHVNERELFRKLGEEVDGAKVDLSKLPTDLMPSEEVRMALYRHVLSQLGQAMDDEVLDRLDTALTGNKLDDLYYTVEETCAKLGIRRTQLYTGWIKAGYLRLRKLGFRAVFLRREVDDIANLRTTEEASRILGYREKRPTTILRLVAQGHLKAVKMGKTLRFRDEDLVRHLLDKSYGRLRLRAKRFESSSTFRAVDR